MTADKHKCIEPNERQRRLAEWEKEMERKWGKGWEHNPNRPVSIIHDYPPPAGIDVVVCGSKITKDSIPLKDWLKKQQQKQN